MPVTISYDLAKITGNQRSYVRSSFERFGWERLGGSVFRYPRRDRDALEQDDWLNEIIPALMFFRSYIKKNDIQLKKFTIDSLGSSFFEQDDAMHMFGLGLKESQNMADTEPENTQSSVRAIRDFVTQTTNAAP